MALIPTERWFLVVVTPQYGIWMRRLDTCYANEKHHQGLFRRHQFTMRGGKSYRQRQSHKKVKQNVGLIFFISIHSLVSCPPSLVTTLSAPQSHSGLVMHLRYIPHNLCILNTTCDASRILGYIPRNLCILTTIDM